MKDQTDQLTKEIDQLRAELTKEQAANQGYRAGCCEICWTNSFEPCSPNDEGAVKFKNSEEWVSCKCCRQHDWIIKLTDELTRTKAALTDIAMMPEIDQDDAHRLRHKAKLALDQQPAKTIIPQECWQCGRLWEPDETGACKYCHCPESNDVHPPATERSDEKCAATQSRRRE